MINDRYYVKIVPQKGDTVHRFHVRRRHVWTALGMLAAIVFGCVLFGALQVGHARAQVAALRAQTLTQRKTLEGIDRQTDVLRRQLQAVQKQNTEIKALIGVPTHAARANAKLTSWVRTGPMLRKVEARVAVLARASQVTVHDADSMKTLAMRVLNMAHLRSLARARLVAAIPSIDPVAGATVIGCFCYRTYPDVEFHEGVDLGADYGDPVRAAAAGTVVAAGWDGGYGIKIDIDHGNGYHTWYAHLSKVDVSVGEHVYKGEKIARVGATGFATGPHLHYQIMYQGTPINPAPFLHGVPANVLADLP